MADNVRFFELQSFKASGWCVTVRLALTPPPHSVRRALGAQRLAKNYHSDSQWEWSRPTTTARTADAFRGIATMTGVKRAIWPACCAIS